MRDKQDIRERIKYETELLRLALLAAIGAVGGVVGLILVLSPYDFDGFMTVMPAQTGIQESQAEASGYPAWIPAFAGMTQPRLTPQIHTD